MSRNHKDDGSKTSMGELDDMWERSDEEEERRAEVTNFDAEQEGRVSRGVSYGMIQESTPGCWGRHVVSNPQQIRGGGDKETGSPIPEIVGEVEDNMMKIIHEMNSCIYRLFEQTNARQRYVLEE